MKNIPQLPWQIWLVLSFLLVVVVALLGPGVWSLIEAVAEIMTEVSLFIQSMVLPCLCLIVLSGLGYGYFAMRRKN